MHPVISGDLLHRLAATDRLHGDLGLELWAVGSALMTWTLETGPGSTSTDFKGNQGDIFKISKSAFGFSSVTASFSSRWNRPRL